MNQQTPSAPQSWQLLARGSQENDQVAQCPAGHIHLDYGNFSLRFGQNEFLVFAAMVAGAAGKLTNKPGSHVGALPHQLSPMTFSLN